MCVCVCESKRVCVYVYVSVRRLLCLVGSIVWCAACDPLVRPLMEARTQGLEDMEYLCLDSGGLRDSWSLLKGKAAFVS